MVVFSEHLAANFRHFFRLRVEVDRKKLLPPSHFEPLGEGLELLFLELSLKESHLDVVMNLRELFPNDDSLVTFKAGATIFKEGEKGDSMYILFEGIVDVVVGDNVIGSFEPVEIFGEMLVISPGPRSATVVAKSDCKFGSLNPKRFMLFIQSKPNFAQHIMQMLVERIRWMNEEAKAHKAKSADRIKHLTEVAEGQTKRLVELDPSYVPPVLTEEAPAAAAPAAEAPAAESKPASA